MSRTLAGRASLVVVLALIALPAQGEAPERLNIRSDSSCPSAEEVANQLAPLMPETQLAPAETASELETETVTIREIPGGLRVDVAGEVKEFRELPGDCTERARTVAVLVHLKYSPLLIAESAAASQASPSPAAPSPDSSASPPSQAETAPVETEPPSAPKTNAAKRTGASAAERPVASNVVRAGAPPNRWGASLSITAMTNLDARALSRSLDYGVSARGWIGNEWALAFGVSVLLPSKHDLSSGVATEGAALTVWRTPADLAVRYQRQWTSASLYGELGLETALLRVSRLTAPGHACRLEWGPRAALGVGWVLTRDITLGASLFATFIPMPYEFRLEPRDSLGTSPAVWGGASLGVWF